MTLCWNLDSHQFSKLANLQCDVSDLLEEYSWLYGAVLLTEWKKEEKQDRSKTALVPMKLHSLLVVQGGSHVLGTS